MTPEEYKLLVEHNIMLKQILVYIASRDGPNNNVKDFDINVIANFMSNNTDGLK